MAILTQSDIYKKPEKIFNKQRVISDKANKIKRKGRK